jgi:hypothetical protein
MATTTETRTFAALEPQVASRVSTEAGVLHRVAVITEGPALGHGLMIDATTLEQVKAAAETYRGGLKVKLDHYSGITEIVGYLTDFAIEGTVLRADLHLLESTEHRAYVLEIAEKIPASFGLSISFSGIDDTDDAGTALARCTEIYSADLVSEPAANPSGLFNRGEDAPSPAPDPIPDPSTSDPIPMTEEEKAELFASIDEKLGALASRLSLLEEANAPEKEEMEAEDLAALVSRVALETAKETIKHFNLESAPPPAPVSEPAEDPDPTPVVKTFADLVRAAKAEGQLHNDAVRHCMQAHPDAYQAYLTRVQAGEHITF